MGAVKLATTLSSHPATRALAVALAHQGYRVTEIENTARVVMTHPRRQERITLVADMDDPTRIRYASVDGRPTMTVRAALDYVQRSPADVRPVPEVNPLTLRQRQVVRLLAEGLTEQAAAEQVGIEPTSVAGHVERAIKGAKARNLVHLVAVAVRNDWLTDTERSPLRKGW